MNKRVKPEQEIAFNTVFPQLSILIVFIFIAHALPLNQPMLTAAIYYLVIAVILRMMIPRHHRRGMRLIKKEFFNEALEAFEQSLDYFTRHAWIDRNRHLVLVSSSSVTYREMAMLNIAYCLGQLGRLDEMKKQYESTLAAFPKSRMAHEMLARMKQGEKAKKKKQSK